MAPNGRRCGEEFMLEYDHVQPYSQGGDSNESNIRLLCRNHNQWRHAHLNTNLDETSQL